MYDVLVKNGKTIQGNPIEIGISGGKIAKIADKLDVEAKKVLDANGQFISAGWIDSHVHCYEKMNLYYDYPDEVGIKSGVTTVVDAGTAGEDNIRNFYQLAKKAKTNVFALLNISRNGIVTQDELSDLSKVDEERNVAKIKELKGFIIGIKARMSASVVGDNGVEPLCLAKKLQARFEKLPLMVHIGSHPPDLKDIFDQMEAGDIVTHCYNGKKNGILDENGQVKEFVKQAYRRGIVFDVGHGTESFDVNVARVAKAEKLVMQTISTDIYVRNRTKGPVYNMATTLDKMRAIGYTLEEVIEAVTKNPSETLNLSSKGQLKVGLDADLTIFQIKSSKHELVDSKGKTFTVNETIQPTICVVGGEIFTIGLEADVVRF